LEGNLRPSRAATGLGCRAGCQSAGSQSPAFTERGAIADLDRDAAATSIQFCPKRIGFIEWDRILGFVMRSEYVHRFTSREDATAHVALFARMVPRPKSSFEHVGPIFHRLIIHLQDDMLNDCWSDAFVGESKSNRAIAAVEFEDWPYRRTHLLALHVGGVTGNTHSK